MFAEELAKQPEGLSDTAKIISGAIGLIISHVLIFFAARRKTASETSKNIADAHKSEAETTKTNVATIASLVDQINSMIQTATFLRTKVAGLEGRLDDLKTPLDKAIVQQAALIDDMVTAGVTQNRRIKAVRILEMLYAVRAKLRTVEGEI